MDKEKFQALLIVKIPSVIELIEKNMQLDELKAIEIFYGSKVYSALNDEPTKVWQYSPLTIYNMFKTECETCELVYPD